MEKLELLWQITEFNDLDPGERYFKQLISSGKGVRLSTNGRGDERSIELPDYYDKKQFQRAQQFYLEYRNMIATSNIFGVVIVLLFESILNTLSCTKKSSTMKTAYKRYVETIFHVLNFYKDLPEDPKSVSFRSLVVVKHKHEMGSTYSEKMGFGFINQRDMALTQFAFFGLVLVRHKQLAISYDEGKMSALIHFWGVIGYVLGMEEEYNLCSADFKTVESRCNAIMRHAVVPGLLNLPPGFDVMSNALLDSLWCINTDVEAEKFIFFTRRLCGVPGFYSNEKDRADQLMYLEEHPQYCGDLEERRNDIEQNPRQCSAFAKLPWGTRWDIRIADFILENVIAKYKLGNWFFNQIFKMRLFWMKYFPYIAIYQFGIRTAYNIQVLDNKKDR